MTTRSARFVVFCSVLLLAVLAAGMSSRDEPPVRSGSAVSPFLERVTAYTQLRQQIITNLLENGIDPNAADDGREFRNRLGLAIREARRHAQPGEIFCAEVAGHMRQAVWNSLQGASDILLDVPEVPSVRVNDFYPEDEPLATVPPLLLQQLEPLPPELQYRFLATDLILLDIDTALIVDFIPNAFERRSPALATRFSRSNSEVDPH
jgi:hypothetical protein